LPGLTGQSSNQASKMSKTNGYWIPACAWK
jgi:hypothetical protein